MVHLLSTGQAKCAMVVGEVDEMSNYAATPSCIQAPGQSTGTGREH